jgi:hypothetical protein
MVEGEGGELEARGRLGFARRFGADAVAIVAREGFRQLATTVAPAAAISCVWIIVDRGWTT